MENGLCKACNSNYDRAACLECRQLINFKPKTKPPKKKKKVSRHKNALLKRQAGICILCARELLFKDATMEHLLPISLGGSKSAIFNLGVSHGRCNWTRGSTPLTPEQIERVIALHNGITYQGAITAAIRNEMKQAFKAKMKAKTMTKKCRRRLEAMPNPMDTHWVKNWLKKPWEPDYP